MTDTSNLRNEDFRKLLSAPKKVVSEVGSGRDASGDTAHSFTHRHQPKHEKKRGGGGHKYKREKAEREDDESNLKEILKNYRDRALERRQKGTEDADEAAKLAAAYRAVPGDARAVTDKANLRKQAIEESKYLGGDMEHTHLVKGLDYSLLNKVRSEIIKSQADAEVGDELDRAYDQKDGGINEKSSDNKMVRGMQRLLFKNELPFRNELFGKGRMAYVVEMEDDDADIPTTLLRSVHDCPQTESNANINANNLLISKLTQVLSYLRTDHKKKRKQDMTEEEIKKYQNQNIYDNETEYVPKKERDRERRDDRDKDRRKDRSYFDSKEDRDRDRYKRDGDRDRRDKDRDRRGREYEKDRRDREREREKDREREKEKEKERREREEREKEKRLEEKMEKRRKEAEGGGYDECYPGGLAEMGGGWDSDEEDFSKMDAGAKKPPIKRWDFENEDDYEKFQGAREAMPKAAYQFGLKTGDGRKTRKSIDVNKKIDNELNQINKILEKRKAGRDSEDGYKRPKY